MVAHTFLGERLEEQLLDPARGSQSGQVERIARRLT
jgi:hypothetical protein